jgi:hypothetical protein
VIGARVAGVVSDEPPEVTNGTVVSTLESVGRVPVATSASEPDEQAERARIEVASTVSAVRFERCLFIAGTVRQALKGARKQVLAGVPAEGVFLRDESLRNGVISTPEPRVLAATPLERQLSRLRSSLLQ